MPLLSDPAIKAILHEWNLEKYDPLLADKSFFQWSREVEGLCEKYGIPDAQRAQCALTFMGEGVRAWLENHFMARAGSKPTDWASFKGFMGEFDRCFLKQIPSCDRYSEHTGTALGIAGCVLLTPITPAAFDSLPSSVVQNIVAPLQLNPDTEPSEVLFSYDDDDLLTTPAVKAIVKSWNIPPHNPQGEDTAAWLKIMEEFCKEYKVPKAQHVLCVMRLIEGTCREAAEAEGCKDMEWNQFETWLLEYNVNAIEERT